METNAACTASIPLFIAIRISPLATMWILSLYQELVPLIITSHRSVYCMNVFSARTTVYFVCPVTAVIPHVAEDESVVSQTYTVCALEVIIETH